MTRWLGGPETTTTVSREPCSILLEHTAEVQRLSALSQRLASTLGCEMPCTLDKLDFGPDLKTDNRIQAQIGSLRTRFLSGMGEFVSRTWLTPPTGEQVALPGTDETYRFCYDRQHVPEILERRISAGESVIARPKHAMLCGSGMAAINTIVQSLAHVAEPGRRCMGAFASYFETHSLLRMSTFSNAWTRLRHQDELLEAVRLSVFPVVLIEPVHYNWSLDTVPVAELLSAIDAADQPPIIILDTTLCGHTPHVEHLIRQLAESPCPLLVRARSGLKLDQEGLELASVGVLEWWPRRDLANSYSKLMHTADAFRTVSGSGLGRAAACSLSPSFVLDRRSSMAFSEGVFGSNRAMFELLHLSGDLFSAKTYPSPPWESPFVLLSLRRGNSGAYIRLASLLKREARRRGLDWIMSGSFGFRTERFETILPGEQVRFGEPTAGVLKIAAGRYRGARFWAIVDTLNELASFDTLDEAEAAWCPRSVSLR
jgi:hypothetical protein